jgi:hypothetical protein
MEQLVDKGDSHPFSIPIVAGVEKDRGITLGTFPHDPPAKVIIFQILTDDPNPPGLQAQLPPPIFRKIPQTRAVAEIWKWKNHIGSDNKDERR